MRYYVGVDWADREHVVWVEDDRGTPVAARTLPHTAAGFAECGRQLEEWRQAGIELWAGIERPEGRRAREGAPGPQPSRATGRGGQAAGHLAAGD